MKSIFGKGMTLMALTAAPAFAISTVEDPWDPDFPTDELNLYEIYNGLYGTSFDSTSGATGGDLNSGGMDELRVDPDEVFASTEDGIARFIARYSARDGTFGYYTDLEAGPTYVPLFTTNAPPQYQNIVNGNENLTYHVSETGGFVTIPAADSPMGFYDYAVRQSEPLVPFTWHSEVSRNADGEDHMVAFYGLVEVEAGVWVIDETTILLAFGDLYALGDADYNDLVVQVTFPGGIDPNDPVAEPATAGLLALGLLGGFIRRRFFA